MTDPATLSIAEAGERLREGSLTSVDLVEAALARIEHHDPVYRAFVARMDHQARESAQAADAAFARGEDLGPLQGIPVAIKDIIDIAGQPTTCCSFASDAHPVAADAEVVRRLRQAGAVIVGKVATYEYAVVGPSPDLPFPPATNPWNPDHITGGSSSGSAAAVAGGLVRTALGSDTGGSIRSPSSYCGIVGLKPSFGRVSREGVVPLAESLDHIGPLSASVADAAITLDALSGHDPRDPHSRDRAWRPAAGGLGRPVQGLRIGYARSWFIDDPALDPAIGRAMDDAVAALSRLGMRVEEIDLPDYALLEASGAVVLHAEALAHHRARLEAEGQHYGRQTYESLVSGVCLADDEVALARRAGARLGAQLSETLARFDAIITVDTLTTAPPFSAFDGESAVWTPMRTLPFNVTGHPVLAMPIGLSGGLPMGMQLVGAHGAEDTLCAIGQAFENATDHAAQRPPQPRHP